MAKVVGVGGVFVRARDVEKMCAWYVRVLGVDLNLGTGTIFDRSLGSDSLVLSFFERAASSAIPSARMSWSTMWLTIWTDCSTTWASVASTTSRSRSSPTADSRGPPTSKGTDSNFGSRAALKRQTYWGPADFALAVLIYPAASAHFSAGSASLPANCYWGDERRSSIHRGGLGTTVKPNCS